MERFDLMDFEWSVIHPLSPNKSRGVPLVDHRRLLNGIIWRSRAGALWADIPSRCGPYTTCVNRFNRWRKAGVWDHLLNAVPRLRVIAFNGNPDRMGPCKTDLLKPAEVNREATGFQRVERVSDIRGERVHTN